jgi:predicted metal-dependent hydrolase
VSRVPPPSPPEPTLSPDEQEAFERGLLQFNERLFFECHDTLEDLWSGVRGPSRDFFQGLIQVAVGFYHLGNGNETGAVRLLERARKRLGPYPARYGGVALGDLRREVEAWLDALAAGGETARPPIPTVRLEGYPSASGTGPSPR